MIGKYFNAHSIRKRLVVLLFTVVFLVWMVTTVTSFISIKGQVDKFVDLQLVQFAHALLEIDFEQLEDYQPSVPQDVIDFLDSARDNRSIYYQIWKGDTLVLHSLKAPKKHISREQKFTDAVFEGNHVRVFTLIPYENSNYQIEVMADTGIYSSFIKPLSEVVFLNQMAEFILMAILLWLGISAGLQPLQALAATIRQRDYKDLTTIELQDIPDEIVPVVQSLNDLFDRLHISFESEREFASHAAHELRTPLAALKMQAQVALREKNPDKQAILLEKISDGVDRSSHLVDQLLILARVESDSENIEFTRLSLCDLAHSAVTDIQQKAESKNIRIDITEEDDPAIFGHRETLLILMRNILDNAINYSPAESKIMVRIYGDMQYSHLQVIDQGPGIREDMRDKVLKKFVRLPGSNAQGSLTKAR